MTEQLILAPDQRRQIILDLLRSTRERIMLSLFRCDDSRVLDEIVATAKRKVDVQVLVTPRARGWNRRLGSLVTLLKATGVDVKQYHGPWTKYHAKYIIVDGETAAVCTGNLTRKCFERTCDFVWLSQDPDLVSSLTKLFEFDMSTPDLAPPVLSRQLIVGPEQSRERMIGFVESARANLRIIDHRVTHPELLLRIAQRSHAGVHIQILGRGEVGESVSHGKLMIVDDELAILGSASLSRPGLDIRREVSVVIRDRARVAELTAFFDHLAASPVLVNTEVDEDEEEDN